jgi:hypothetical protein
MSSLHRFLKAELLYFFIVSVSLAFLGFYPPLNFDDAFLKKTGLLPFIDLRPGYPPIGKLPYFSLFILFSETSAYSISVFLFNALTLFLLGITLYFCVSKLNQKRALSLPLLVLIMPSVLYFTLYYSHADALAMIFALGALYFIENPSLCGALCAVGALVKFYPAVLLLPLLIFYKGIKKRVILLFSFILIVLLISLPFLLSDPLMYVSVVLSNNLRGPSESIFSIIDGYYGHTGFAHPTFDATIYSWQFARLYEPSSYDHFRYQWNIPVLPYLSTGLQIFSIILISLIARRRKDRKEAIMLISLAMFSYFAFSTFYNPIIHLAQICWLMLATLNWNKYAQISTIASFEAVNILHSLVWFTPALMSTGVMLPLSVAVILRTILYIAVFLNFARRRTI